MGTQSAHILVVDHEPLCLWALTESLADAGFQVSGSNGDGPIGCVEPVDVLVLDATLPPDLAVTVLQQVRIRNPRCRVMLMTDFDEGSRPGFQAPLTDGWRSLEKPFDMGAMVAAVKELAADDS